MKKVAFISLGFVFLMGCGKPKKEHDKASYAMGHQVGTSLKRMSQLDFKLKWFCQGVKQAYAGQESHVDRQEVMQIFADLQKKEVEKRKEEGVMNKTKGEDFLVKNKEADGVKVTSTGLQYKILSEGSGKKPKKTDKVSVHYKGRLINGEEFDSSYKRNKPAEFVLNRVIPGWTEGIPLMKEGAKYEFYIPSALAYGPRGTGNIPPNSTLIFEVELLKVLGSDKKAKKSKK